MDVYSIGHLSYRFIGVARRSRSGHDVFLSGLWLRATRIHLLYVKRSGHFEGGIVERRTNGDRTLVYVLNQINPLWREGGVYIWSRC